MTLIREAAKPPAPTSAGLYAGETLLRPEEHVLATLEADGSRRWLFPRLAPGLFWQRRRWTAYGLIAFFTILPHLRLNGKPPILLDVPARRFTILGYTFLPTDTLLLALLMVSGFVAIFLSTAMFGRVWCGWGCPQTVYMEFVFRPIDRLFQGLRGKGGKPTRSLSPVRWWARIGVYLVLCSLIANTFLAYFVGTDTLWDWMQKSPLEHPTPFLIMATATLLMAFDFLYFREQTCMIACPYGRFQSVMLDRSSMIVTYDQKRGEPRGRGKHALPVVTEARGDCVDCHKCVQVCPTGIDIRNGLQLECIHCAQCIDACHEVMEKLHKPTGLIRYSNQDAVDGIASRFLRARIIIYPLILTVSLSAFAFIFLTKKDFDAKFFRIMGNSFSVGESGLIDNSLKLSLTNRTDLPRDYSMSIVHPNGGTIRPIESPEIHLQGGVHKSIPVLISAPFEEFHGGRCQARIRVTDNTGEERLIDTIILGPYQRPENLNVDSGQ